MTAHSPSPESLPETSTEQQDLTSEGEASPYTPNFKYKANDQEFEIDEEYRSYIKSADDEKRIKRLFEQFKGVDKLKNWHKEAQTEAQNYRSQVEQWNEAFNTINSMVSEKQYTKALKSLGFTKDMIYHAAQEMLQFDELPQQVKQVYHANEEQERYAQNLYRQNLQVQQQLAEVRTQAKAVEVEQTLGRGEVKDFADRYDAAHGPGSFRQRMIQTAQAEFYRTQTDISAQQAAEMVIREFKPFVSAATQTSAIQPKQVPVIPATGANSRGSPTSGSTVKSVADLEKAFERKMANRR